MSQAPRENKSPNSPDTNNTLGLAADSSLSKTVSMGAQASAPVNGPTVLRNNDDALSRALSSLPNYELLNKLGEGGMGAVYKARQRTLNRTVAIKVLPRHLCDNALYVARLNREALVLARINHPNVTTCFDLGEHQGMRYVVMEYVEGESLSRLIEKRKQLPPTEALYYIKQSVLGLDCANAQGIIHRDIKPDNMLLAKAASPGTTVKLPAGFSLKIADLGLAAFTSEQTENTRLTAEGSTLGSPHYMSPEQTIGESDVDFRTDIYALGITLYHMLTGIVPYEAPTIGAVLAKKLTESIKDPREVRPELPPAISLLIHKMTARKRSDRYSTYGELLQDIEAIEQNGVLAAEILTDDRASVILSESTINSLKASGVRVGKKTASTDAERRSAGTGSSKWIVVGVAAGMLVIAGAFLMAPGKTGSSAISKGGNTILTPNSGVPATPATTPDPPKTKDPTPPPVEFQSAVRLIENRSTEGWDYKGDNKDFGFQDGGLFLQCLKGWNRAQRSMPSSEYSLRAFLQTFAGVDDGEVQLCMDDKTYVAVGIRLPVDAKSITVYVETRELTTDKVIKLLAKQDGLSVDDWHDLKVNVWERGASCFLNGQFLVNAELSESAAKCQTIRLASRNGIIQYRNLEVTPRPK
jgi:serine/threonine protein kinase